MTLLAGGHKMHHACNMRPQLFRNVWLHCQISTTVNTKKTKEHMEKRLKRKNAHSSWKKKKVAERDRMACGLCIISTERHKE